MAEDALLDDKVLLWAVHSLWRDESGNHDGDMFYQIDKATGKKMRIADKKAKDLIAQGKAELILDEDSLARLKFVLADEPASKAYWLARDGTEREINFKSALELIMNKKAKIQDIAAK